MNGLPAWVVVVAGIVSVITMVVSRKVLKDAHSPLSQPLIPACVGLLAFVGMVKFVRDSAGWLLLPYVALAISIVLILLFLPFINRLREGQEPKGPAAKRNEEVRDRAHDAEEIRARGMRDEFVLPEEDADREKGRPYRHSQNKINEKKGK